MIRCPTLMLRGAQSDPLSLDVVQIMTQCGSKAKLVELTDVGYTPTLLHFDQIEVV